MLTKKEKNALLSIWLSKRHILFIEKYVKNQKEWEWMPKNAAILEIIWIDRYNDYKVALMK